MVHVVDFLDRLPNDWRPRSQAQKMALACPAEVLCYGGSVGSLKSETVLLDALRYKDMPKYSGIIFRRTYPEMDFLINRTRELYSNTGGRYLEGPRKWVWPWGATIYFRHMDREKDVYKHQGFEYQYVAFDESTHHSEAPIRYILNSRMRSVNDIPLRMRLATNPGNIGSGWHRALFHGARCIHCVTKSLQEGQPWPSDVRHYGQVYSDAKWPSDKIPINHTTCFIPGKVTDHNLLGGINGAYVRKLRGLPLALQEALIEGCWDAFEGQYFDCFDIMVHALEREAIEEKTWWPYWIGVDYGFAHACVAYLFTKSPQGIVYVLDEYVIHRRKDTDVANDLEMKWGHYKPRNIYLSPDAFKHDGKTDFSSAERMAAASNGMFERAYNERVSGWLLCYELLDNHKMFITRDCPLLLESIPNRVHSNREDGDIEKIEDDGDDAVDAWRYGVASEINPTERPDAEVLQEKFDKEWSDDPTTAMMQYLLWQNQSHGDSPIGYRPRAGHSTFKSPQRSLFDVK